MSILIIGPLPDPVDGCSFANQTFCLNLKLLGVSYDVINTNAKQISSKQGGKFSLKKAIGFCKTYLKINKITKAKVVYFTPGQTFFGLLKYAPFIWYCQIQKKPYCIHIHGNYLGSQYLKLRGVKKRFFKSLVGKAAAGIVLSESLRANFKNLLSAKKVHIVKNFVPNEIFKDYDYRLRNRKSLQVVYLSNLMKGKGVLDVLDALLLLKNKNIDFEATFAGKIEKEIEFLVKQKLNQLNGRASYIGVVRGNDKIKLLNKSNVFILPTYYQMEGQPISILEAMASGNIIISTKHAGIPDVMSQKNGFFVEKKNPEDLAGILERIENDLLREIERVEMINIESAKENFTEKKFCENILSVVEEMANGK